MGRRPLRSDPMRPFGVRGGEADAWSRSACACARTPMGTLADEDTTRTHRKRKMAGGGRVARSRIHAKERCVRLRTSRRRWAHESVGSPLVGTPAQSPCGRGRVGYIMMASSEKVPCGPPAGRSAQQEARAAIPAGSGSFGEVGDALGRLAGPPKASSLIGPRTLLQTDSAPRHATPRPHAPETRRSIAPSGPTPDT